MTDDSIINLLKTINFQEKIAAFELKVRFETAYQKRKIEELWH
jgi:hypothetical protein